MIQIHGSGFGHFNFGPATPILSNEFRCIDYDQRGYGQSEKPEQEYDLEVWADDAAALVEALGLERAHVHGTSMGGMVAILMAGKYPERVQSVVINCAAAKLGYSGQLVFRNWIDLIKLEGCGSRTLAELIAWQCLSRAYMETPEGKAGVDVIQQILRDANEDRVMIHACQAMIDMDLREWVPKITSPALVVGGDEDVMTPWDQGPVGAGQQWIADNLPNGDVAVIKGSNHSTIFDGTEAHCRAVADFFRAHPGAG
ncbi:MAG TPA: alpha/beta hydrolase [Solirubrobacteraceae bacterium]|nr:alpha/beta hydrolase [Solirubrobacteraceae bacterium]